MFLLSSFLTAAVVSFQKNTVSYYSLNPMVGVIDGFRWAILGGESMIYWPGFVLSIGVTIFFLFLGIYQFRKMEKKFADII